MTRPEDIRALLSEVTSKRQMGKAIERIGESLVEKYFIGSVCPGCKKQIKLSEGFAVHQAEPWHQNCRTKPKTEGV